LHSRRSPPVQGLCCMHAVLRGALQQREQHVQQRREHATMQPRNRCRAPLHWRCCTSATPPEMSSCAPLSSWAAAFLAWPFSLATLLKKCLMTSSSACCTAMLCVRSFSSTEAACCTQHGMEHSVHACGMQRDASCGVVMCGHVAWSCICVASGMQRGHVSGAWHACAARG
jgi:hypothetical protein